MSRDSCEPPCGTAEGTRHILRRGDGGLLMDWYNNGWRVWFPEIPGFVTFQPTGLAQDGWRYAGPCPPLPELPELPKEAWEIAFGALLRTDRLKLTEHNPPACLRSVIRELVHDMEQIAAMRPRDAP